MGCALDGLVRRGGVWYARLVVPSRLRALVGKTELVSSTGVRDYALGRVVAAERLPGMATPASRSFSISRERMADDLERIAAGHRSLLTSAHLRIRDASRVSRLDVDGLLREAATLEKSSSIDWR